MSKTDLEYIKEYTEKQEEKAKLKVKPEQIIDDANKDIEDATRDKPDLAAQIKQRKLHREAAKLDAEDASIEERKEQSKKDAAEKERIEKSNNIIDIKDRTLDNVGGKVSTLQDNIASMKTTGGIALLLVILAVLLLVVVQVNAQGDTRLKQIWYMLNGRSTLQGKINVQQETNAQGAGSSFGPGSTNGAGSTFSFTPTDTNNTTNLSYFNTSLGYRGTSV